MRVGQVGQVGQEPGLSRRRGGGGTGTIESPVPPLTHLDPGRGGTKAQSVPPSGQRQRFALTLEAAAGHWPAPVVLRLRGLLKDALRRWGLKCVAIRELREGEQACVS